jgi:hypothetical protein
MVFDVQNVPHECCTCGAPSTDRVAAWGLIAGKGSCGLAWKKKESSQPLHGTSAVLVHLQAN